jgi:serine protease inhibitor
MTRFTSQTPSGQERAINIRAPLNGAEVSGSITITGDITIAPFENNLTYTVYDSQYRPIAQSYTMVNAPDFGAPGTFALTIDLAALGLAGDIYIEITDLSAADGSVLALSQVHLKVR